MLTGTTIMELEAMVQRIEANAESARRVKDEITRYTIPVYAFYSPEQIREMQRGIAPMGVA